MPRAIAALSPATLLKWIAPPLAVFAALLGALALVNRSPAPTTTQPSGADGLPRQSASLDTEGRIRQLQAAVRANPDDAGSYALLGDGYYQRARETGDPSYYTRAEGSFDGALAQDPQNVTAIAGQATLALARHDFGDALGLASRARALAPQMALPYAPLADAQIELGRYGAAARTLNRMVRLKANLAAYARISYFRELHGDLSGALVAMRYALSAGAGSSEGEAYVQGLQGKLLTDLGHYGEAEHAYREALAIDPRYPPALAGAASVEASRGRLGAAIGDYRRVVERLPLPEYAIALGETEEAAGRTTAAKRDYALVGAEAKLLRANGVNTDVDLALFEANHGSPRRAVTLGRRAWEQAPSVRSADAYAWALHAAGRTGEATRFSCEAMRLGSRDPSFLYHAGMIARRAGQAGRARHLLDSLVAHSPRFNPLYGPRARRALEALG